MENKKQQQNLIETLKQNCRRIVREKLEKNRLPILISLEFNGDNRIYNNLCNDMVDNIFSVLPVGIQSNKEVFREKIEGMDPGAPKNPKIAKKFFITTIITTIIFIVIYYLVEIDLLNLREFLK